MSDEGDIAAHRLRRTAFVDESMRESVAGGLYLVAGAVLLSGDLETINLQMRRVLGGKRRRVHWHNESVKDREQLLAALAGMALQAVCVAVQPSTARRQERARERGLWSLLAELQVRGVTEVVFERRQNVLNRRDERTLGAIQRAGIATNVCYRFAVPDRKTPVLWAADAVAGAVALHVAEGDDRYLKRFPEGFVSIHNVAG